ncbi:MAG TPA: BatA domain-containing protein [Prolixibacteraceae bacterium]|nr:BatA domain-containing protein [Prolixibacteraceae bacterium]
MSFLYPAFLFALVALAIPVIIHFFNFRKYKTLYFSNVSLLKLIKQESRKKSRLKQLIMLAARLLALACLVFAFSRPYLPLNNRSSQAAQQVVTIFIDNTFSMKNVNEKGQLLEQAKLKAIEAANSYRQGAQFILLTSDFLPQHRYVLTREQFIQQVSEIKESPRSPLFSEVYSQAVIAVTAGPKKADHIVYFLSDFQKNSVDLEAIKPDSSVWTYLLPFRSEKANNLLIDSCWFEIPVRRIGQQEKLFVRLENLSDQAYQNIPIRLNINDSLRSISNVSIAGRQDTIVELSYTNNSDGIQLCKVELDDYPIIYDNAWFMSYKVRGRLKALGIFNPSNNSSEYLKALFSEDDLVSYDEFPENNVQIGQLKDYQCIFLLGNQHISSGLKSELISFVEHGGSLVLIPGRTGNTEDFNALLAGLNGHLIAAYDTSSMGISEINYSHALYNEVFKKQEANADLPLIHGFYRFTEQINKIENPVLRFRNGKNALGSFRFGNGQVYSFAFPVDEDNMNFIRHMIFVPTVYNMVLNSEAPRKYVYPIESDEPVILDQARLSEELKLVNHQTGDEFKVSARQSGAGRQQVILNDIISEAGHYLIYDGEQAIQSLSYNFPRQESDPVFLDPEAITDLIGSNNLDRMQVIEAAEGNFSEVLQDLNNGKQLWKMFIMLAILFLFIEMAVARFWKQGA